ncbi:MAG: hypothetical protein ACYCZF_01875 [Anaerolineae bacterium]
MGVAGKLQTQTDSFWRDEFEVSDVDLDLVTSQILEAGRPQEIKALSSSIVLRRYQREKEAAALHASSGDVYQPKGHFEPGQRLLFTAMDLSSGRVQSIRAGYNPKYGEFNVIRVIFETNASESEFVSDFPYIHPLNRPLDELFGKSDDTLSEADLVKAVAKFIVPKLEKVLSQHDDFVTFDGKWFLRELLPDMHVGFLNLAEALIDQGHHPLAAREILADLDLQITAPIEAQLFALNLAMGRDERFDNVSLNDEPVWFLRALEPQAAFKRPATLVPAFAAVGGEYIGSTLLEFVEQVGDELDSLADIIPTSGDIRIELTFPHLYAGTLPASDKFLQTAPKSQTDHLPITLIDSRTGQRIDAWLRPADGYICGLTDWYKKVGMCVGAMISLAVAPEPLAWTITISPIRGKKSEWISSATVIEGILTLKLQRVALDIKAERNLVIDVPGREVVAGLMGEAEAAGTPLATIVFHVFDELAKQTSSRVVHAKSIYSAVNLVRRSGTVPVFAELTRRACFDPVGGGMWALDPSQQKTIYLTPDEMRDRPLSARSDTVKDPAIQYGRK